MNITPMSSVDLDEVVKLGLSEDELRTETDSPQFTTKETLERWIKSPNGILLVAREDNEFVGFSISDYNPDSRDGCVHAIVITPKFRGRGVGSRLIERTLEELKKTDCNHVYCLIKVGNRPSAKLFEEFGFVRGKEFHYTDREL